MGHIFLPSLKTLSFKIKISAIYPPSKIVSNNKHGKEGEKAETLYDNLIGEFFIFKDSVETW